MTSFKRVAVAAAIATFLLVTIGGLVRATKSGLGCGTDWPACSGRLLPAVQDRAMMIEYSHRAAAGAVVILLGVLAVKAFKQRQPSTIKRAALVAFGLVLFQALLGMVVVVLELQAISVVLHLATALALLATTLYIAITADTTEVFGRTTGEEPRVARDRATPAIARATAGVFILLLVGSYVSGADAGYVFADWPLMDGTLVPDLSIQTKALHFVHRALAVVVGVMTLQAGIAVIRSSEKGDAERRLAHSALGLFALEILVGAGNVFTSGNEVFVTLHLALGAGIWASLVALAIVTRRQLARSSSLLDRSQPALESS